MPQSSVTVAQISARKIAEHLRMPPPTDEQVAVIEAAPDEPLLVVAGAGSGKTETMAARVVWLVANKHVEPEQILGLTFTRKAAGELATRVRARLRQLREAGLFADELLPHERALATPTIMTYNAYAARLVSEHALRLGVEPDAITLSEAGQWQLVHEIINNWPDDLQITAAESTAIKAVLDLAGSCAEHLISPAEVGDYLRAQADRLEILAGDEKLRVDERKLRDRWRERANLIPVVERYIARKRADNLLDFSDQVSLIAALVRHDPQIGAGERERFGAVLLDEYQDTSHAQVTLLSGLFDTGHPVTAVGDPLQAIYGWRGASAGALLRFPHVFPARDKDSGKLRPAAHTNLTIAWRNDEAILAAANKIAAPLLLNAGASESGDVSVKKLRARPNAGPGRVEACFLETSELEAQKIAEFMAQQRGTTSKPRSRPVSAAVLCRTRSQFDAIMAALIAADVPVEVVGLGGLLNTPEVTDVVAMLQAMHDPSRGDALIRLLTNPRWQLGIKDLHALSRWARKLAGEDRDERSIIDALDELSGRATWPTTGPEISPAGRERFAEFGAQLRQLRSRTGLRLVELVAEVERALLFDIEFAIDPVRSAQSLHHLEQFREVAARYESTGGMGAPVTLGGFLDWLEVASAEERGLPVTNVEPSDDAVQLLTVHAAKGLEWDVVAVSGLIEGTFPSCKPPKDPQKPVKDSGWLSGWGELPYELRGDADGLPVFQGDGAADVKAFKELVEEFHIDCGEYQLAEERRLAYVAFTRARHALFLTGAWWVNERKSPANPSRFLTALVRSGAADGALPVESENDSNPLQDVEHTAQWPQQQMDERRAAIIESANRVQALLDAGSELEIVTTNPASDEIATWQRHADLLLAEERAAAAQERAVDLPEHLSASALVSLVQDAREFALMRRRPIPQQPTTRSRLGTAFHSWVEQLYGTPVLVDLDDLPGAQTAVEDSDLAALQEVFANSAWAQRQPIALEVDIDTPVAETTIRCRIDAVFQEPDGRTLIVDWKTGAPPKIGSQTHRERSVQLAIYRLAWARLHEVEVENIDAVFVHVSPTEITEVHALPLTDAQIAEILAQQAPGGRLEFA